MESQFQLGYYYLYLLFCIIWKIAAIVIHLLLFFYHQIAIHEVFDVVYL